MSKSKWRKRTFDTRLSFSELCRKAGINVRQRIILMRYFKQKIEGGEQQDEDK